MLTGSNNNAVGFLGTTASTSLFQWVPRNVKSMNRRNKMSSEVFKVPVASDQLEDSNREGHRFHCFRIVLLRGVVRADSELDDPLAVFVEYLAPTADGDAVHTEPHHPEGCKVAVWCVQNNRVPAASTTGSMFAEGELVDASPSEGVIPTNPHLTRGEPHIYGEETFVFSPSSRMLGFKALVPAHALNDDRFVDPSALNAMILRVEITTGVSTVAEVVARTTDRWSSSLWGSATSVFAVVAAGIDAVSSNVKGWLDAVDDRTEQPTGGAPTTSRPLPWEEVPPKWAKAGKSIEEWAALLTVHLPENEGTFLFGPERGINPDEQVLLTQLGLQHKTILNASSIFDYNRDVHEGLLSCQAIRRQRYELVPGRISDERFWANFMWKAAALATATTHDQIQLLLSILNAPPTPSPRRKSADGGSVRPTNASRGGVLADREHVDRESDGGVSTSGGDGSLESLVGTAVKDAMEAMDVLRELLEYYRESRGADADSDEVLIESAVTSCRKQRSRIALALEKTTAAANRRGESVDECALCAGLRSTLRSVDDVVDAVEPTIARVRAILRGESSSSSSTHKESTDDPSTPAPQQGGIHASVGSHTVSNEEPFEVIESPVEGKEAVQPPLAQSSIDSQVPDRDRFTANENCSVTLHQSSPGDEEPSATHATVPTAESTQDAAPTAPSPGSHQQRQPSGSDFDELPEIEDGGAPKEERSASTTKKPFSGSTTVSSPTGSLGGSKGSSRKIEFEPMPWDDEE